MSSNSPAGGSEIPGAFPAGGATAHATTLAAA